ncbi:MAG: hypothetical protein DCC74_08575 [Proteobacteria bacterium]|nr:MAG: hypothetical protein DCC74_08575 [Pseudomonadota bacterium]
MRPKTIVIAIVALAVAALAGFVAVQWLPPSASVPVAVAPPPPLPPATRASRALVPVAIPLTAIRDALDAAAPRDFAGKGQNPAPQLLSQTDIDWRAARGAIAASGGNNVVTLTTPLTGTFAVRGELSTTTQDAIGGMLGQLLGSDAAKRIGGINIKNVNADADIRGNVTVTARPQLAANWRIAPNLAAAIDLGNTALSVGGIRISVPGEVKPVIDNTVNEQLARLEQRLRNDPTIEQTARREWAKMCRSIPLQGEGLPPLWLELKPVRAIAAQPVIDAKAVTLTLGVEAESRVTSSETRPDCPFPATLALVDGKEAGRVAIGVPIDMPFTALNALIDAQLKNKTFPDDGSGAVAVTVKSAKITPSGQRLLISLAVDATEQKSFFGFGANATVHVWGKPVLDAQNQVLRLADLELAVESEAAFGLLGTAARAAMPYLQRTLAEKAVIDLKPFATDAQKKIAAAIADFRTGADGVAIDAQVTGLKLVGIAFDATTLRVIAEANGTARATVTRLPAL